MTTFGVWSTIFDFLTFGALLFLLHATPEQFRTGWFLVSIITELLVLFVIRTQGVFYKSRPGRYLLVTSLLILIITLLLPYTPIGALLCLIPLSGSFILVLAGIITMYFFTTEVAKRFFFKKIQIFQ